MNRGLIAHLDAIEARWTQLFTTYHSEVIGGLREIGGRLDAVNERLDRMQEDIAGIKVDLATHGHDEES